MIRDLHSKIEADIKPLGGVLRCRQCGYETQIADEPLGQYLAQGWPQCCGETRIWITDRQLRGEVPM